MFENKVYIYWMIQILFTLEIVKRMKIYSRFLIKRLAEYYRKLRRNNDSLPE